MPVSCATAISQCGLALRCSMASRHTCHPPDDWLVMVTQPGRWWRNRENSSCTPPTAGTAAKLKKQRRHGELDLEIRGTQPPAAPIRSNAIATPLLLP